jgi:hypothetical protein
VKLVIHLKNLRRRRKWKAWRDTNKASILPLPRLAVVQNLLPRFAKPLRVAGNMGAMSKIVLPDRGLPVGRETMSLYLDIISVAERADIRTAYLEREVKTYAIFENEVHTISMWNTLAGVFTSAGAATLSFAIGIWTNAAFAEKATAEGNILSHVVVPAFCVVTLICSGIAIWAIVSRRGTWTASSRSETSSRA